MRDTVPINKNSDFLRAYKRGKFYVGRFIVLYCIMNPFKSRRLGIVASKKIGNSVKRNRVRRLIKEAYRGYEISIKSGRDLVFVARETKVLPTFSEIKKEMRYLLKKLELYFTEKDS